MLGSSGANRLTASAPMAVKFGKQKHESKLRSNFEPTPCLYNITTGRIMDLSMTKKDL
jgi:hypothetical protein